MLAAGVHETGLRPRARRRQGNRTGRCAGGLRGAAREQGGSDGPDIHRAETAFRDELRAWLAKTTRAGSRTAEDAAYGWRRDFQRRLADGGWAAVHWPPEYGGRGATLTQSAIFFEELARAGAPLPANVLGLLLAGPTIMMWGTPEQKDRYLAPIVTGEEIWCQGFSEPEAGSDLAALKTRAVKDGDDWVVTGQKVWTSGAQYSKWCMLVARTDTEAPKHKGLTYFLMDMEQEAIQVRPLRQITGEAEFNELFIEEARIPDENVLGGVGNGWKVALTTLMNERAGLAFFLQVRLRQVLDEVFAGAAAARAARGPGDRRPARRAAPQGRGPAADRLPRADHDRAVRTAGPGGLADEVDVVGDQPAAHAVRGRRARTGALRAADRWCYELLRARGNTIEGGTTEILKNIVAERVLGLPKAR